MKKYMSWIMLGASFLLCGCSFAKTAETEETQINVVTCPETVPITEPETCPETETEEEPKTQPEAETNPMPETNNAQAEPLTPVDAYLQTVTDTDQMLLAIGNGTPTGADFYAYKKIDNIWTLQFEAPAHIGQNGFSDHTIEGDGTTPTGCYPLGISFGNKENPGTSFPWTDVNENLYWVDDPSSPYYNTMIDRTETPDGWNSGEHLIEYTNSYAYSINIEVNPDANTDSTSAIFLHCYGSNEYTLGCIAVPEDIMVRILREYTPGTKIMIARDETEL